jgi:hypothetical protein
VSTKLDEAIDGLADVVPNGHLLAAGSGYDLLIAATEEIVRLRTTVTTTATVPTIHTDNSGVIAEAQREIERLTAALAEERARPRPKVQWETTARLAICVTEQGKRLGRIHLSGSDPATIAQAQYNATVLTAWVSIAEARAALVAAADAAGFDVSACRDGEVQS